MDEYIERQASIREFETNGSYFVYGRQTCNAIISRLKLVPAADVRPVVRGEWIYTPTEPLGYTCSACQNGCCRFAFCPYCGSYNGGDAE